MKAHHFAVICALALCAACAHQAPYLQDDGGRGTRVTNPRIAPWAFYRGETPLLVGQTTEAGDVIETQCAHNACAEAFHYLTVWQVVDGRFGEVARRSRQTHPDREQRIKLAPQAEFLVITWTRAPLDSAPSLDLTDGTRKAPHSQSMLTDDAGREVGVIQWGPVDVVR